MQGLPALLAAAVPRQAPQGRPAVPPGRCAAPPLQVRLGGHTPAGQT